MALMRNLGLYKNFNVTSEGKYKFGNVGIDWRIILKCILKRGV
jgi:hypothetical protein